MKRGKCFVMRIKKLVAKYRVFFCVSVLLLITVILAVSVINPIGEDREPSLLSAIEASPLSSGDKSTLRLIISSKNEHVPDLMRHLFTDNFGATVVWTGKFTAASGSKYTVILFDRFVRQAAATPEPLTAVLLENDRLVHWQSVAPWSIGFVAASLTLADMSQLTVITRANWARTYCIDKYDIVGSELHESQATDFTVSLEDEWKSAASRWKIDEHLLVPANDAILKAVREL